MHLYLGDKDAAKTAVRHALVADDAGVRALVPGSLGAGRDSRRLWRDITSCGLDQQRMLRLYLRLRCVLRKFRVSERLLLLAFSIGFMSQLGNKHLILLLVLQGPWQISRAKHLIFLHWPELFK